MEYILGKKIYFNKWCVTTTQVLPDLRILIIYVREHFVTNVLSAIRLIGPNRLPSKINFKLFNLRIELNITEYGAASDSAFIELFYNQSVRNEQDKNCLSSVQ